MVEPVPLVRHDLPGGEVSIPPGRVVLLNRWDQQIVGQLPPAAAGARIFTDQVAIRKGAHDCVGILDVGHRACWAPEPVTRDELAVDPLPDRPLRVQVAPGGGAYHLPVVLRQGLVELAEPLDVRPGDATELGAVAVTERAPEAVADDL